ncbi:MAG: hypothetical protein ACE366_16155 [Bradymonadia bacterium]
MRGVAEQLGISLAALQYHYPTKSKLIEAFIEQKLEEHRSRTRALIEQIDGSESLAQVIRRILDESRATEAEFSIMMMIEARALHDEGTAQTLHRGMCMYVQTMQEAVSACDPTLDEAQSLKAATLIISLIEGTYTTFDAAHTLGAQTPDLIDAMVNAVLAIPEVVKTI